MNDKRALLIALLAGDRKTVDEIKERIRLKNKPDKWIIAFYKAGKIKTEGKEFTEAEFKKFKQDQSTTFNLRVVLFKTKMRHPKN